MPEKTEKVIEKIDVKPDEVARQLEQNVVRLRDLERRLSVLQQEIFRLPQGAGPQVPHESSAGLIMGSLNTIGASPGIPGLSSPGAPAAAYAAPGSLAGFGAGSWPRAGGIEEPLSGRDFKALPPTVRAPPMNVVDEGPHYLIQIEMPGVKKEDLEILVSDRSLTIEAEGAFNPGDGTVVRGECPPVQYRRTVYFPTAVKTNSGQTKANIKDGILTLQVTKKEPGESPRRLDVGYG